MTSKSHTVRDSVEMPVPRPCDARSFTAVV